MANPLICVFNPVTSFIDEVQSVSTGPAAIGAPIVTNVAGLIDASLIGSGLSNVTAGETTSGGNLVALYSVGGVLKMQLAWAGTGGTGPSGASYPIAANGFVILGTTVNNSGIVQFSGIFTYIDGLSEFGPGDVGAEVYLSATNGNKGGITKTRPSGIGQLQQTIGQVVNFTNPNVVQVSFTSIPNPPLLNFSNISSGTNTAATMTVGAGATLTQTGGGIINANQLTSDPVNTSGRTTGQALVFNGTTWVPSSAPATTFSAITSGTNTTATMTVGGGASLTFSGGTINANQLFGVTISGVAPTVGQVLTATSPTAAHWATSSGAPGGVDTDIQFNQTGAFGGEARLTWAYTTGSFTALAATGTGAQQIVGNANNRLFIQDTQVNLNATQTGSQLVFLSDGDITLDPATGGTGKVFTGGSGRPSGSIVYVGLTSGSAELGCADVAGTPNRINLPITTGTAGQFLQTNGANPQQTSWATPTSAAGGSPTQIQYNLAGALAGIAGSSVTAAGAVALAPTGTGVALKVTGDAAASNIQNWFVNGAGTPAVQINSSGTTIITVDAVGGTALNVNGQAFIDQHFSTAGGAALTITGDNFGVVPIVQVFTWTPSNEEVVRINELGHLTVEPTGLVGTWTQATLTAVGDNANQDIQQWVAYNGGTPVLTNFIDQYGNFKIQSRPGGGVPGLAVKGAAGEDIAMFLTSGAVDVVAIDEFGTVVISPNGTSTQPALSVTGATAGTQDVVAFTSFTTGFGLRVDVGGNTQLTGGFAPTITPSPYITTTHTATANEYTLLADTSGGAFTIHLPITGIKVGQTYRIKNIGNPANLLTIDTVGGATNIDFGLTQTLAAQGSSMDVQWDGTQWWIL